MVVTVHEINNEIEEFSKNKTTQTCAKIRKKRNTNVEMSKGCYESLLSPEKCNDCDDCERNKESMSQREISE